MDIKTKFSIGEKVKFHYGKGPDAFMVGEIRHIIVNIYQRPGRAMVIEYDVFWGETLHLRLRESKLLSI